MENLSFGVCHCSDQHLFSSILVDILSCTMRLEFHEMLLGSVETRDLRDHPDPDMDPDPDPDPVGFGIPNRVSPGSGSGRVQSLRDGIGTGFKF